VSAVRASDATADGQTEPSPARVPRQPVRRLIAYERRWFVSGATGWLLFHLWPLLPGLIGKEFFDVLQGDAPAGVNLGTVLGLTAAVGIARMVVVFAASMTADRWRFAARGLLQRNLLARLLGLPARATTPAEIGRTVSTLRDDTEAISMMGDWTFDALSAMVFTAGTVAILLSVDARVTILVALPLVGVIVLAHFARTRLERFREHSRATSADVAATIGDVISAVGAIRVAGHQAAVVAHLRRQGERRKQAMLRDELFSAGLDAVFANLASLGAGLVLLVAAAQMRDGRFTVGDFVLFTTYLMQMSEYTGFIGYLARTRRQASVSWRRAASVMYGASHDDLVAPHRLHLTGEAPTRPLTLPPPDADPLRRLSVTALTGLHDSGRGVRDVTFSVGRGSLTVVTGRVGAGKTTLLRTILGLLPSSSGEMRWNGQQIAVPSRFMTPPRVAYTPQRASLLSTTLRENIMLGLDCDDRLDATVRQSAMDRDVTAMPDGLDTEIGVNGVRLSGGQVLRTAVARMLVRQPGLIVIDDVSSALDVETEAVLWQRLFAIDATYLVVSHRRQVLDRADQIVVLRDGRVAGIGRLPELLERCPEMRELLMTTDTGREQL
jgi:ATP-binding cassette, subfamily B, bacterial